MLLLGHVNDYGPLAKAWIVRELQLIWVDGIGQAYVLIASDEIVARVPDLDVHASIASRGLQIRIEQQYAIMHQISGLIDALVRLHQHRMLLGLKV